MHNQQQDYSAQPCVTFSNHGCIAGFEVWKSRALVVHNSSATFWQARQVCINEGGDLASLTSLRAIQATVKLANAKDIQ